MHTKLNLNPYANAQPSSKTWHLTTMAVALGVLMGFAHVDANALSLGRITSLSSLGEPFAAGIDIPDINTEEIASLKATLASPEAFKTAGMEYNTALASVQITLTRRENGSSYLLLRSEKIVSDPFVNLIINANWSTGRIVRNYTLLLDPPAVKQIETATVTAPMAVLPAPAPISAPTSVQTPVPAPVNSTRVPPVSTPSAPVAMPKAPATKSSDSAQKPTITNSGEQIKVSNGDTAGKIAAKNLPANVSLDQMLAAMLRGNPKAFIDNNINRLKAGVILDLPTDEQAAAVSASEARQSLVAQSKDFSSFRRKLAENAPALTSKTTDRVAGGKIEAKVDDQKAAAVTPDKLTLSKGGSTTGDKSAIAAEKIAKERQAKDDAARSAELAKNIKDLNKLASATPAAPDKAAPVPAPAAVVATAPAATTMPVAPTAPAEPKPPVVAKAPVVVAPVAEPSAIDSLMDDPLVLPAAGGLLIALLAGGLYANNKRKNKIKAAEAAEDALLEAQEHEESFFSDTSNEPVMEQEPASIDAKQEVSDIGAIETPEINTTILDTRAVVDPLTEANVYLDYGRDVQAEEILKDGLKTQPQNVAIYAKLMDIYAQRRDAKSFENMALKAKILLSEDSVQWQTISKQGFDLEPQNLLYRVAAPEQEDPLANLSAQEFSSRTLAQIDPESAKAPASVDLDLDFNFASSFPASTAIAETKKAPLVDLPDFSLELDQASDTVKPPTAPAAVHATHVVNENSLPNQMPQAMAFDLNNLSLDLNNTDKTITAPNVVAADNNAPFETKLALAQEFRAIGDTNGAKMLAREVLATATGNLKVRAEAFLAEIG
jgi:pilus assembly protein FimV